MLDHLANLATIAGLIVQIASEAHFKSPKSADRLLPDLENALEAHLKETAAWSSQTQIPFARIPSFRTTDDIYISLTFPYLEKPPDNTSSLTLSADELLIQPSHAVIVAHLGSGKTTTVKHLCRHLLTEEPRHPKEPSFPFVVRLREIPHNKSLLVTIAEMTGAILAIPEMHSQSSPKPPAVIDATIRQFVVGYFCACDALLLLDGLDELAFDHRDVIISEIQYLLRTVTRSKVLVTSRPGATPVGLDNAQYFTINPFSKADIATYIQRWFGNADESARFGRALNSKPYKDTVSTPLHLANLCRVFTADKQLPDPPCRVYERVIMLRLREWDDQRKLHRVSAYSQFPPEQKRKFLGALWFYLAFQSKHLVFDIDQLKVAYKAIHKKFGLPSAKHTSVLDEVVSHTGLIQLVGSDRFEFVHKSLMEYLLAEHITLLPRLTGYEGTLFNLPNECAIATELSSAQTEFMCILLFDVIQINQSKERLASAQQTFLRQYLWRVLFEHVHLTQSRELGYAVLLADARFWLPTAPSDAIPYRSHHDNLSRKVFAQIWSWPEVAKSIRDVLELHYSDWRWPECVLLRAKDEAGSSAVFKMPREFVVSAALFADLYRDYGKELDDEV